MPAPAVHPPTPPPTYRAVLRAPGAPRAFAASLVGRLSFGTVSLALTVALTDATGSYAVAGTVLAVFGLSASLLAPVRAELVVRRGPRAALPPLSWACAALLGALAFTTWRPAPTPVLLVLTLLAGGCAPPFGAVMRTLWSDLAAGPALRRRAFSLDTVAEELLFVAGPLIAGAFVATGSAPAGVAVCALLVLAGGALLATAPALRTARHGTPRDGTAAPEPAFTVRVLIAPVLVACGIGIALGALDLLIVVFAQRAHRPGAVAWPAGALSVGSAVGGVLYGARHWRLGDRARLSLLALALAAALAATGLAPGVWVLVAGAAATGLFVAPALSTAYLLADDAVPPAARTRAGTWVSTAFNAGSSAGTALVGLLVEQAPLALCFALAAAPSACAALLSSGPAVRHLVAGRARWRRLT
ncbi:MFS transporter [Streptomyces sp. NPDC050560]|uniref:MFS transporter n=1 Tax=Streptomyces sp. NPDC050560 TaxID=3365630 RepID=UPI00379D5096